MLYFLINNDYHLDLDLKLVKQLTGFRFGLIQVPYSLKPVENSEAFSDIFIFPRIIPSIIEILFYRCKALSIFRNVDELLKPDISDVLLVHSDIDILNHYIIHRFHRANSRIFLLEDGTATMCTYNMIPEKAGLKDRFRAILLRNLYKLENTTVKKYGSEVLPVVDDKVFSGVIVNFGDSLKRKIPLFKLKPRKDPIKILFNNGAIFLNQAQYIWYTSEEKYISYLTDMLIISEKFTPFFFKFHPSDKNNVKAEITKLIIEKFPKIKIIEEDEIAEKIITRYPVRYAITFNSSAVLNLINRGVVPVFLNNLFGQTFPDKAFETFDQFLHSIGCNSPDELSDVKPGFSAFRNPVSSQKTYSIVDILNFS